MANKKRYTAKELEHMQWGIINKEIEEAAHSDNHFSRRFVLDTLLNEHNLNEGDCGCDRFVPDPRMAALQQLLKKD